VRARHRLRGPRLAYRSLYRRLPGLLDEGERVVAFGDGYVDRSRGAYVVLTDRRLLAIGREIEEIALGTLHAVECIHGGSGVLGFTGGGLRLETDGGERVVRVRPRALAQAMADALQPPPDRLRGAGFL
jgi:hypothetical protein